jgi:8-oxo-dGTP pyrophosphatase MutT (NUDIX family)
LVWTIPKGHLEAGESAAQAAVREVCEETGIEGAIERLLGDTTYWYVRRDPDGTSRRILKRVRFYLMRRLGGRFEDRDHEMDAVRWFSLPDAEAILAFPNERALLRRAGALIAAVRVR